ncbi:MAG: acyltransferase [Pseudomonadota bacterium]
MISVLFPGWFIGIAAYSVLMANLILWGGVMIGLAALFRFLIPIPAFGRACSRFAVWMASNWASGNRLIYRLFHDVRWEVDIRGELDPNKSYLLICNHQSWVDILLLFDIFHTRLPLVRFFLKRQLLYVPIIGPGCWVMDFPFMRRHSREAIEKNPALREQDLKTIRRSCEIYKTVPVTVVNFVEGTRFSEAKRAETGSPFRHLLRPKSAGISFALNAMGEQFAGLIDVTIAYQPTDKNLLWSFLRGEQSQLAMHVDVRPIPQDLIAGDYQGDAEFRTRFQNWLNELWTRKDARLDRMIPGERPATKARTT